MWNSCENRQTVKGKGVSWQRFEYQEGWFDATHPYSLARIYYWEWLAGGKFTFDVKWHKQKQMAL